MDKKHELRTELASATDALVVMAGKTAADGFDQDVYDALETKIADTRARITRVENAEKMAAALATPLAGQQNIKVPAQARKRYSKLKAFKDHLGFDGQVIRAEDDAYAVGMWMKAALFRHEGAAEWCKENGISITRALSEGVDSSGGFLVPEQMMASIIVLREQYGVFRQEATIVPMGRDTVNWPRRTGGLTAYFVGENTSVTESAAAWDNVNLTAKKLGVLTRFSTELDEDAVISIADWLVNEIAYAFSSKEDDCGFNGDGTSLYGGIRGLATWALDPSTTAGKYTAASGHNTYATLDATDITGLIGLLPRYALGNAKFYISQMGFASTFERIIATAGGNTIATLDGEIVYRYLGFPIVVSQKLPLIATTLTGKMMMAFGDLRLAAALGERRQVTVRRSDERYFDQDQIGLLGTERVDVNVHDCGTTTAAGPIVFLVAP
jgi:HK97 family phage major capsid protein